MKTKIQSATFLIIGMIAGMTVFGADVESKLKVLLITGGHGFDENAFFDVFRANPEIALTTAAHGKTNADAYERADLTGQDVVVLYDMPASITGPQEAKFMQIFDKGVGLVVLHHALGSMQDWGDYEKIIGGRYPISNGKGGVVTTDVGYQHDLEVRVVIVARNHPVTAGVDDFTIHDEIYWGFRVGADVTPLLTTTHPKSGKPLAWCRTQGKSRVVYLQLGHGPEAFANPNYRKLVANAIRWTANK
jgi:type 1 glutamine amidotransferase